MENIDKNRKINFCCIVTLLLESGSLVMGQKMPLCNLPLHFQGQLGLFSCMIALKECFSLTMVAMEIAERRYFNYQSSHYEEDKIFHQKHESYTFKLSLIKLSWLGKYQGRKNVATSRRNILRKRTKQIKIFLCIS